MYKIAAISSALLLTMGVFACDGGKPAVTARLEMEKAAASQSESGWSSTTRTGFGFNRENRNDQRSGIYGRNDVGYRTDNVNYRNGNDVGYHADGSVDSGIDVDYRRDHDRDYRTDGVNYQNGVDVNVGTNGTDYRRRNDVNGFQGNDARNRQENTRDHRSGDGYRPDAESNRTQTSQGAEGQSGRARDISRDQKSANAIPSGDTQIKAPATVNKTSTPAAETRNPTSSLETKAPATENKYESK